MRLYLVVFLTFSLGGAALAETESRRIVVTGEGLAQATPDMATVSIGVSREARMAGDALAEASRAMAAVMDVVQQAGVEARDMQTSNIGLNPRYQHSSDGRPPRITGYIASNTLVVRVRQLGDLGSVLDAVVADGANALNGLSFGISEPGPLESEARASAVRDAAEKARELAEAAGVSLGPVITITEGAGASRPQPILRGAMMEAAMDVPVAAGELDIRAQVTMVYEISE